MKKFFLLPAALAALSLCAEQPEPPKDTYDMELNRGRVALSQQKYKEADECFAKAEKLANQPWQRTRLLYVRAASLALQKKYAEASALLKTPVPPNQRSTYHTAFCAVMCGEYAAAAGNMSEAEREWKAALDAAPHNWIESRAMMRLGQSAESRGDYGKAMLWYARMKKNEYALPAARARGYMMSAALYAKMKQFDEAYAELNAAEKVQQIRPDMFAGIAMLRADLLTKQSRHKESYEEVKRALKIQNLTPPPQVMLLCRAAKAEWEMKNYKAAAEYIRRAKKIRAGQNYFEPELEKKIERDYADFERRSKIERKKNRRK